MPVEILVHRQKAAESTTLEAAFGLMEGLSAPELQSPSSAARFSEPLTKLETPIYIVHPERSIRGMALGYVAQEDAYQITCMFPSAPDDWQLVLEFAAALAVHLESRITILSSSEAGTTTRETFAAEEVQKFDWRADVLMGLKAMREAFDDDDIHGAPLTLPGLYRDMNITEEAFAEIENATDPIAAWGAWTRAAQYPDALISEPRFYRSTGDGRVVGVYLVAADVAVVLPRKMPHLPTKFMASKELAGEKITWKVMVVSELSPTAEHVEASLADFMAVVPEAHFRELDAFDSILEALPAQTLLSYGRLAAERATKEQTLS